MTQILVHGANSFLGRNFIKSLLNVQDVEIAVIARHQTDLQYLSNTRLENKVYRYKNSLLEIETIPFLKGSKIQFFNFAWFGVFNDLRNDIGQFNVNVPMIIDSITLAKRLNVSHWIGFGSQAEYGIVDNIITEKTVCNPTTLYGKAKLISSNIAKDMCFNLGIKFTWLRLFSLYGPNDNHKWFVHYLINELIENREIKMTLGEQLWDYLYIEDAVSILNKIVDLDIAMGITNYASGNSIKLKEFVKIAKSLSNSSSKVDFGAVPYREDQVMNMKPDISKLKKMLKWNAMYSYKDGLRKYIKETKCLI